MIFRFIMLSDEVDNFKREYRLDSEATFLDLRNIILESTDYKKDEMSSFFICNDSWEKESEITLIDMGTKSEEDSFIMEESVLGDFLEDEKQKLMFVFDYLNERAFFMELREIIFGEDLDNAEITKSIGKAPLQFLPIEEETVVTKTPSPVIIPEPEESFADFAGEDFYGEEGYNDDELDDDSFDDFDGEEGEVEGNVNIDDLDI